MRFALARDREGRLFRFTPLQSDRFRQLVPADRRQQLPDSIVVLTEDNRLLTRSDAVLHMGRRIGGVWGTLSALGLLVPRPLRDAVYDVIARIRKRLFRKPDGVCPVVPRELRDRFVECLGRRVRLRRHPPYRTSDLLRPSPFERRTFA